VYLVEIGFQKRISARNNATLSSDRRDSFATALIAHLPGLRRYATALAGSVNAADDLVQDCIERALTRWESLRDPQRMAGWLRSILYNLHMDEVRRRRSQGIGTDLTQMDNDTALSAPPEDRGMTIDFMRAFKQLSAEHRQILLLVGLEGLKYRQISTELDIPIGTVMSRLARAREQLRDALEEEAILPAAALPASGGRAER
jgi:RNA polymerase sigma-70 factor (ECF subfamily)